MKKYTYVFLLTFSVLQLGSHAADETRKTPDLVSSLPHMQTFSDPSPLEKAIEFFEIAKKEKSSLKKLTSVLGSLCPELTFISYAHTLLKKEPGIKIPHIVSSFIQTGAQTIIKSGIYTHDNKEVFSLIERLDPLYWYYNTNFSL
jgi:hypothetical protein